jgi:hypothetical protein
MSDVTFEMLAEMAKGGSGVRLGPGCQLEHQTEHRDVLVENEPIRHESREGHRISGCNNENQNTDWLWGDWR